MATKRKYVRAWHWVGETLRDGSPIPKDGEWLEYKGPLQMCKSGLHASRNPFDALQYAPGATLCLVDCDGIGAEQQDKLVSSRRRIVARMDATELCRYFGRQQAIGVLDNWETEPEQCVLDWLMCDDNAESAAWNAARSAAESAAESAAWNAARSAARSAAKDEFTQLVYECFEDWL